MMPLRAASIQPFFLVECLRQLHQLPAEKIIQRPQRLIDHGLRRAFLAGQICALIREGLAETRQRRRRLLVVDFRRRLGLSALISRVGFAGYGHRRRTSSHTLLLKNAIFTKGAKIRPAVKQPLSVRYRNKMDAAGIELELSWPDHTCGIPGVAG